MIVWMLLRSADAEPPAPPAPAEESVVAPRLDPHARLRERPVPDDACAICHSGPATEAEPALHLPAEEICASCHLDTDHVGMAAHLDHAPEAAMAERARAAGLPLPEGRVGCTTCHDPHPAPPERPWGVPTPPGWFTGRFGPAAPGSDLARLAGPALCTACHDMGGEGRR